MLTVLLPVTRPWARLAFCSALAASDVPRQRLILVADAPGCEGWADDLAALGFHVEAHYTNNPDPPPGREERRDRHRAMRRLTQALVYDGPLLCLEDDTIVPPDVYARLSAIAPATGVQVGRHESRAVGVYRNGAPVIGEGIEDIDACGHYCLLTTGEAYRAATIPAVGQVDTGHTAQIDGLRVDWDCVCGHLAQEGVLMPENRGVWGGCGPKFRTLARVVRDGSVICGPKASVNLAWAVSEGLCDENGTPDPFAVYEDVPVAYSPVKETKPARNPRTKHRPNA